MTDNAAAADSTTPTLQEMQGEGDRAIQLQGMWNLRSLTPLLAEFTPQLKTYAADTARKWDLQQVQSLDSAAAALLWRAWDGKRPQNLLLKPEHEKMFEHLASLPTVESEKLPRDWLLPVVATGKVMLGFYEHLREITTLLGQVVLDFGHLIRHPQGIPWREVSANLYRTGAKALQITALVGFLVGVVLSYLFTKQLRAFGADIYIVNILGISILRELGPVLAAILVAGRSGSSMTAQLGVMRVTQELDALSVMGISHTMRLVLPKILSLAVALPLLILWTNAIALLGGAIAANAQMHISLTFFFKRLPDVVPIANLLLGVGKGAVFGLVIALIACHFGLRIKPNTESLGAGTTSSVVTSITSVIIIDAIFAVLFSSVGIT